ncbi:hypothetical secreted protein [Xanthomonas albilineans GPE PC73]|uniref:Hypothetical secreted protein n=1 Tax=Xanthomonas albilineans (strain GPE PC73 / CFBP 7063) TaxID=380358 RepID=D2U8S8_XANAP|nr:hypothetical secreted protein [Xanthomonas albilineans GPE PC73]
MKSLTKCQVAAGALISAMFVTGHAAAQCCPSGGSGSPKPAAMGLGESFPVAENLSANPAWRVYKFSRDGIAYVQINDAYGRVHAAIGSVGNTAWVMPIGRDADNVGISNANMLGTVIYNSDDFTIRLLKGTKSSSWIVVPRDKK